MIKDHDKIYVIKPEKTAFFKVLLTLPKKENQEDEFLSLLEAQFNSTSLKQIKIDNIYLETKYIDPRTGLASKAESPIQNNGKVTPTKETLH